MPQPKNFAFGADETLLRDTARKFLSDQLPTEKLHRQVAGNADPYRPTTSDWDPELWQQVVELGWSSVIVPGSAGGIDMGLVALSALVEECGRAALPSPFFATSSASLVLRECDSAPARALLGEIVSGRRVALATTPQNGSWQTAHCDVDLGDDNKLRGSAHYVQDAGKAQTLVVKARHRNGIALCAIAADATGVDIIPDAIIDLTRDQAHIHFDAVALDSAALLASPGAGATALEQAEPGLLTLVAADICGAGEWLLQTTVEYMQTRQQFDRPLGYFQALKHPLVNLMIMIDQARSLTYNAACAVDHEPDKAPRFARMAKARACEVAAYSANRAIQSHGGIGFTWEAFIHIYTKRQKHNQMLYGDATYQRAKLAELLFD